ncbi:MAG: hypothetical protein ACP5IT_10780, partial [Thermoproteota archaeon]
MIDLNFIRKFIIYLVVVNTANIIFATFLLAFSYEFQQVIAFVFLLESAFLFVYGGVLDLSASIFGSNVKKYMLHQRSDYSPEHHKNEQAKANMFIAFGTVLFIESILTSII